MSASDAAAFNAHHAGCTRCAGLVAQVGGLVRRMQRTEAVEMPDRLVANILDATLGPRQTQRGLKSWFGWAAAVWQPRFAMGALTVASSFAIVLHAAGVNPAALSWADLNPANVARSANRQAHLTYGRAVKFVDDLQLVYEIRSQLEPEPQPQEAAPAATPAPQTVPQFEPEQQTPQQPARPGGPAPSSQPKSQVSPHGGPARPGGAERSRREMRDAHLLAFASADSATTINSNGFNVNGSIR
jgi:hypothetical protein